MKIQYLGHSCFLIEAKGKKIIVDPFITHNPLNKSLKAEQIQADFAFVTHAHQDHLADLEIIAAHNPNLILVSSWEIVTYYEKKGIKGHPMNIGGKHTFDFGTIKWVNAVHSSSFPDGSNGGNPMGFVLDSGNKIIYFAGDTALTYDMQLIPMLFRPLDAAILPVGGNFTMDGDDALLAAKFIHCDKIIGCHYDTFEPIKIDKPALTTLFAGKHKELIFLDLGGSLDI